MHKLVLFAHPDYERRASIIAERLNVSLVKQAEQITGEYCLELSAAGLALVKQASGNKAAQQRIRCDFVAGALHHRRLFGGGIKQALARAAGLSSAFKPGIADLTAGLGRDSFVLASLGASVTMVERNDIVAALLSDGLERLRRHVEQFVDQHPADHPLDQAPQNSLASINQRLSLHQLDGRAWLESHRSTGCPDVIYLDPMFPERAKSAKVKKEMAVFSGLVGRDDDAGDLLESALNTARYRVVVKRPRHAPSLGDIKPGFSLDGKTTRFDIYPLRKIPR